MSNRYIHQKHYLLSFSRFEESLKMSILDILKKLIVLSLSSCLIFQ